MNTQDKLEAFIGIALGFGTIGILWATGMLAILAKMS